MPRKTRRSNVIDALANAAWRVLNHDNDPHDGQPHNTANWMALRRELGKALSAFPGKVDGRDIYKCTCEEKNRP